MSAQNIALAVLAIAVAYFFLTIKTQEETYYRTQQQQAEIINKIDQKLDNVDQKLNKIEQRIDYIEELAQSKKLTKDQKRMAYKIHTASLNTNVDQKALVMTAFLESSFNPKATNKNTNGTLDRGLYMLNDKWYNNITDKCAFNEDCAIKVAINRFAKGHATDWYGYRRYTREFASGTVSSQP